MKVLRGFSEENSHNAWVKAEVEVTEDDLLLILKEAGFKEDAAQQLTAREKFLLLESLADICILEQRVMGGIESVDSVTEKLKAFNNIKAKTLEALKVKYVPF